MLSWKVLGEVCSFRVSLRATPELRVEWSCSALAQVGVMAATRRMLLFQWGVHAFYFRALQLILGFLPPCLNEMLEMIFQG